MRKYVGTPGMNGLLYVHVEDSGDQRLLCQVLQFDTYSKLLADAELARSILNDLFGPQTAENDPDRHLQFLYDIIAPLDRDGWTVSEAEVRTWNDMYEAAQVDLAQSSIESS